MKYQLPILLFLVPFVTAVAMPVLTARRRSWCRPLTLGAIAVMIVLAVINLRVVLNEGAIEYPLGGWAAPLGIAWLNDTLAAIIAVTMSSVALLSVVYGRVVVTPKLENSMPFYTLVLLFVSSLIRQGPRGFLGRLWELGGHTHDHDDHDHAPPADSCCSGH